VHSVHVQTDWNGQESRKVTQFWTRKRFWSYFDRFVKNPYYLSSIVLHAPLSYSCIIRLLEAMRDSRNSIRSRRGSTTTISDDLTGVGPNVKAFEIARNGLYLGTNNYLLPRIASAFPNLERIRFQDDARIEEILHFLPKLISLSCMQLDFREWNKNVRPDDDDYSEVENFEGESALKFMRMSASISVSDKLQNIRKLFIRGQVPVQSFICILDSFPNLEVLEVNNISLDYIEDQIQDALDATTHDPDEEMDEDAQRKQKETCQFFTSLLAKGIDAFTIPPPLRHLKFSAELYRVTDQTNNLVSQLLRMIAGLKQLEFLSLDLDPKISENADEFILSNLLRPAYQYGTRYNTLIIQGVILMQSSFNDICQMYSESLRRLECRVNQQMALKNIDESLSRMEQLSLFLAQGCIHRAIGERIEKYFPKLESLTTEATSEIDFSNFSKLKTLTLSEGRSQIEIHSASITTLGLNKASVSDVIVACPKLTKFFPAVHCIKLQMLSCALIGWLKCPSDLTSLRLDNCFSLSELDLSECRSLHHLEINKCPQLKTLKLTLENVSLSENSVEDYDGFSSIHVGSAVWNQIEDLLLEATEVGSRFLLDYIATFPNLLWLTLRYVYYVIFLTFIVIAYFISIAFPRS
jgi:hypothetical protein